MEVVVDWEDWTKRLRTALGADATVRLRELFAPGGVFSDPVTAPTTDIKSVEDITDSSFPDWQQDVTSSHGDRSGGAFEWVGRGTLGPGLRIEMQGCTMVELDADGQVTRWRDYFDLKEIEKQMGATIEDYQDSSGT
ncbi:MAG TPA: nuclear transport factor 2 family protein [Acidimicrobiales bacterium]|nr:nuclear transport factor 2 family protein [Acidimicrobiales bacterium]HLN41114.1 nuclear transport factor 2 family protein [Acidimicrobiales bacterium]